MDLPFIVVVGGVGKGLPSKETSRLLIFFFFLVMVHPNSKPLMSIPQDTHTPLMTAARESAGETHLVVVQKHPSSLEIGSNVKGPIDSVWQNCPLHCCCCCLGGS